MTDTSDLKRSPSDEPPAWFTPSRKVRASEERREETRDVSSLLVSVYFHSDSAFIWIKDSPKLKVLSFFKFCQIADLVKAALVKKELKFE